MSGHRFSAPLSSGLSAIIPVCNSEASLPRLLERLAAVLPQLRKQFEVILVNDGSRDRSWAVIAELRQNYPFVRGIDLMRNSGQHNALLCGIRTARFDTIVTLDDDLQNPPEEMVKLLAKLDDGLDVVYGAPEREQHGFLRDLASTITKVALQNAMGAATARHISAFRAFRTSLRQAFANFNSPFVSIDVLLSWGSSRFGVVRVRHEPRTIGSSNYTLGRLIVHALNMLTGFTTLPLRFASIVGFVFTGFGALTLAYILSLYFIRGTPVQGFPFLASIISAFAGAQLFSLGIIGEYLGRLHFRMMDRPPYAISQLLEPIASNQPPVPAGTEPEAECEHLPWDSQHFGVPIARTRRSRLDRASLAAVDSWCVANRIACLYLLASPDDGETIVNAERGGFNLVDVRTTLVRAVTDGAGSPARLHRAGETSLRPAADADAPWVIELAGTSFTDSRFYFDGRFARERCDRLYEAWAQKSMSGEDKTVWIAETDGQRSGFVSCQLERGTGSGSSGSIGLLAVAPAFRGRGVGRDLVHRAVDYFTGLGVRSVRVVTQARNVAALRIYERSGFVIDEVRLSYHKWYSPQGEQG